MPQHELSATVFRTRAGWIALARTERGLRRSTLPSLRRHQTLAQVGGEAVIVNESDDALLRRAARLLRDYFRGSHVLFDLPLDLSGLPEFTQSVLLACHTVPFGSTVTYGELAARVGNPRAARAVGQVLRRNPLPIIIPCHRVVGANGSLTGFAGGTEGVHLKETLLRHEGCAVDDLGPIVRRSARRS